MKILVNGEQTNLELNQESNSLSKTLEFMGYKSNKVIVELNNLIINSKKWDQVRIKDGDKLEIISIVGGG